MSTLSAQKYADKATTAIRDLYRELGANTSLPVKKVQVRVSQATNMPTQMGINLEEEIASAVSSEIVAESMIEVALAAEKTDRTMALKFGYGTDLDIFREQIRSAVDLMDEPVIIMSLMAKPYLVAAGLISDDPNETFRSGTVCGFRAFVNPYRAEDAFVLLCEHGWLETKSNHGVRATREGNELFGFTTDFNSQLDLVRVLRIDISE